MESGEKIVSCETPLTRRDFFMRLAPIPPDCLRLVSHDTIVPLTRHDSVTSDAIVSNRMQKLGSIVTFLIKG